MTPYYSDESVTLYHGDCRAVLPSLEAFDLAVCDPPYNVGKDYGPYTDDSMGPGDYENWCRSWWAPLRKVTRCAAVFCGHGNIPMWYHIEKPAAVGCWYKPGNPASSILGHVEWEPWLYWHGGDKGLLGGSDVIKAPITAGQAFGHPCPKPISLLTQLIVKARASRVIDPHAGTGTTLVAAKQLGRQAVGIEINEAYCEIAARRLAQGVLNFEEAS